jgi:hypothetical protein
MNTATIQQKGYHLTFQSFKLDENGIPEDTKTIEVWGEGLTAVEALSNILNSNQIDENKYEFIEAREFGNYDEF